MMLGCAGFGAASRGASGGTRPGRAARALRRLELVGGQGVYAQAVILAGIDLRVRPVPGVIAPGGERLGKVGGKAQTREQADERPVIEDDGDRRHAHGAVRADKRVHLEDAAQAGGPEAGRGGQGLLGFLQARGAGEGRPGEEEALTPALSRRRLEREIGSACGGMRRVILSSAR